LVDEEKPGLGASAFHLALSLDQAAFLAAGLVAAAFGVTALAACSVASVAALTLASATSAAWRAALLRPSKASIGGLHGGLDGFHGDFGTGRSGGQGLVDEFGDVGIDGCNAGFDFLGDLVLGFAGDGDHVARVFHAFFDGRRRQLLLQIDERLDVGRAEQRVEVGEGGFDDGTTGAQIQRGKALDAIKSDIREQGNGTDTGVGEVLGFEVHDEFLRKGDTCLIWPIARLLQ
jgi:hypothetical protein